MKGLHLIKRKFQAQFKNFKLIKIQKSRFQLFQRISKKLLNLKLDKMSIKFFSTKNLFVDYQKLNVENNTYFYSYYLLKLKLLKVAYSVKINIFFHFFSKCCEFISMRIFDGIESTN